MMLEAGVEPLELLSVSPGTTQFIQPCVDCGVMTTTFCNGLEQECYAARHLPKDSWAPLQRTPLCPACEDLHRFCHYCRKVSWATPPPRLGPPEATPVFEVSGLRPAPVGPR